MVTPRCLCPFSFRVAQAGRKDRSSAGSSRVLVPGATQTCAKLQRWIWSRASRLLPRRAAIIFSSKTLSSWSVVARISAASFSPRRPRLSGSSPHFAHAWLKISCRFRSNPPGVRTVAIEASLKDACAVMAGRNIGFLYAKFQRHTGHQLGDRRAVQHVSIQLAPVVMSAANSSSGALPPYSDSTTKAAFSLAVALACRSSSGSGSPGCRYGRTLRNYISDTGVTVLFQWHEDA